MADNSSTAGSSPSGSFEVSQNVVVTKEVQSTVVVDPSNPTITVGQQVTLTASGGTSGSYIWSGAVSGIGNTLSVTFDNAGTFPVFVQRLGDPNYFDSNIAQSTINVQLAGQSIAYGTEPPSNVVFGTEYFLNAAASSGLGVNFQQVGGTGAVDIAFNRLTFTAVGTVLLRATQPGNTNYYAAATPVDRWITINATTTTFALSQGSFVYNGTSQGPSVSPTPVGATFSTGGTLSATSVGGYTASATANGNYSGSNSGLNWSIAKASQDNDVIIISGSSVQYGDPYSANATGGNGTGQYNWTLGSGSTANGAAIDPTSGAITARSTGTVVIKVQRAADNNFNVSNWTGDFTVTVIPRPITINLSGSKPYNGTTTADNAGASVTSGSLAPSDSIGFTFSPTSSSNAGSYSGLTIPSMTNGTVPTSRTTNYNITHTGSYTIGTANITGVNLNPKIYNGSPQTPSSWSIITPAGATANITASAQTNVGNYTASVAGTGGYGGSLANVPWSIDKASQAGVTVASPSTMLYGSDQTATVSAGSGSGTGAITWALGTGSTASGAAINSTTGVVSANGLGYVRIKAMRLGDTNYTDSSWSSDFTVNVTARPITVTLAGSKLANGNQSPTGASASIPPGSLAGGDTISYSFANTSSSAANSYSGLTTATIANASAPTTRTGSYLISYTGSYVIYQQQSPQATVIVASPSAMVYGNSSIAAVTAGSGSGTGAIAWSLGTGSTASGAFINDTSGAIVTTGIGIVRIKAMRGADANYSASQWSSDFTVNVTARPITITLSGSKAYNGSAIATGSALTPTAGSLAPADTISAFVAPSANAASYPLLFATITNSTAPTVRTGNYTVTFAGNYVINKVPITAAAIAPLTYTGAAQLPSGTTSVTPIGATVAVSATASQTNAATYATGTVSGNGNYQATLSSVSWTISPAVPTGIFSSRTLGTTSLLGYTVQAAQLNATFSGPAGAPAPTGAKSYALAPDTPSGTPGSTVSTSTTLAVGVYKVRATIAATTNYASTNTDSLWTITDDVDGDGVPGYIETQIGTDPIVANSPETTPANPTGLKIQRPNQ